MIGARLVAMVVLLGACRGGSPARQSGSDAARVSAAAAGAPATITVAKVVLPEPEPEPESLPADAGVRPQVRLVLRVIPTEAEVFWGARRIGVSKPSVPLEILRPMDSGPLDLVVRAPGFLPYHTRLFSQRDESVTVEMVRPEQARTLTGWSPDKTGKKAGPSAR